MCVEGKGGKLPQSNVLGARETLEKIGSTRLLFVPPFFPMLVSRHGSLCLFLAPSRLQYPQVSLTQKVVVYLFYFL
jgi:hypothetical protein